MSRLIVIDSGLLGLLTNPRRTPEVVACDRWLRNVLDGGARVVVPDVADYEIRRELLPVRKMKGGHPMGMFDNLRVDSPLPDAEYQDRTFQTKSLECSLSDYTITHDGRLVLRQVEWEETPEQERPYYGTEEWERGGIVRFFGLLREKSAQNVILDDFHGDIIFYATVNAPDHAVFAINFREGTTSVFEADGTTTPIEPVVVYYKARFTDGRLQWIRRITREESFVEFGTGGW